MRYLWLLLLIPSVILAQQSGDLNSNTVNSTVSSNNTDTTNNYTGGGAGFPSPPPSAIAPSYMFNGSESCLISAGGSIQLSLLGMSHGSYRVDEDCLRIREAKLLQTLNMNIAAVSRACESEQIWLSMFQSGTPCPFTVNGQLIVGNIAYIYMRMNPQTFIPNYDEQKEYYDIVLRIGDNDEEDINTDTRSISDRFRTVTNRYSSRLN
jgi:hypothetical protein